jgi:hypothetical protein
MLTSGKDTAIQNSNSAMFLLLLIILLMLEKRIKSRDISMEKKNTETGRYF